MDINDFFGMVTNVGFPVALSGFLLIRLEKQMNALTSSINRLNTIISSRLGIVIDNELDKNSDSAA